MFHNSIWINVKNNYAAARNNLIQPGKAYRMTAWVNVFTGTIQMATDFRYLVSGNPEQSWPRVTTQAVSSPAAIFAPSISSADCNGQWKLMTLEIPSTVTAQLNQTATSLGLNPATTKWYARAWVGNDPSEPAFTAFVDDVRFYLADAMISTTFYDFKWSQPVRSVDANNNPTVKVVYDNFGRPTEVWKENKANPTDKQQITATEYRLANE